MKVILMSFFVLLVTGIFSSEVYSGEKNVRVINIPLPKKQGFQGYDADGFPIMNYIDEEKEKQRSYEYVFDGPAEEINFYGAYSMSVQVFSDKMSARLNNKRVEVKRFHPITVKSNPIIWISKQMYKNPDFRNYFVEFAYGDDENNVKCVLTQSMKDFKVILGHCKKPFQKMRFQDVIYLMDDTKMYSSVN